MPGVWSGIFQIEPIGGTSFELPSSFVAILNFILIYGSERKEYGKLMCARWVVSPSLADPYQTDNEASKVSGGN